MWKCRIYNFSTRYAREKNIERVVSIFVLFHWSVPWLLPWLQNARWVTVWNWPRLLNSIRDNLLTTTSRSFLFNVLKLKIPSPPSPLVAINATLLQVLNGNEGKIHSPSNGMSDKSLRKQNKSIHNSWESFGWKSHRRQWFDF